MTKKMDEKALADYIDEKDGVRISVDAMLAVLKNEYLPQDGGPSHGDKLKAAEALMARRLGKPRESVEITGSETRGALSLLTEDQFKRFLAASPEEKMALVKAANDGTLEQVLPQAVGGARIRAIEPVEDDE